MRNLKPLPRRAHLWYLSGWARFPSRGTRSHTRSLHGSHRQSFRRSCSDPAHHDDGADAALRSRAGNVQTPRARRSPRHPAHQHDPARVRRRHARLHRTPGAQLLAALDGLHHQRALRADHVDDHRPRDRGHSQPERLRDAHDRHAPRPELLRAQRAARRGGHGDHRGDEALEAHGQWGGRRPQPAACRPRRRWRRTRGGAARGAPRRDRPQHHVRAHHASQSDRRERERDDRGGVELPRAARGQRARQPHGPLGRHAVPGRAVVSARRRVRRPAPGAGTPTRTSAPPSSTTTSATST